MTDFAALVQPDRGQPARSITFVDAAGFDAWLSAQPPRAKAAAAAQLFEGKPNDLGILPGDSAEDWSVAVGVAKTDRITPWCLARAGASLPAGTYRIEGDEGPAALGWLLAQHKFDRYKKPERRRGAGVLLSHDAAAIPATVRLAEAVALVRDMVDTPAEDMGPAELQAEAGAIAADHGATLTLTQGGALAKGYPMVAAVGRAAGSRHAPRMIELEWGNPAHPRIAIVGKGVCFDSGGLDIKPASGMRIMKKDMGGAAHAFALARLVIGARLPVRMHVLVPAVENAIAGNAMRPGDILTSRNGLTVEVSNTDAEGRLILGDALARASEDKPVLILDFATLTGAARVALGPDLPALFCNDDPLAADLATAARTVQDPLWRMPLWAGYNDMIRSTVADIDNAPEGGMAGAVTAALFLQRFVDGAIPWAHLDTFAWRPSAKPGRPKGGEALGLRAAFAMLERRFAMETAA